MAFGTSVTMVEKHYSHLFKEHEVLRQHLNPFEAGEREGAGRKPSGADPGGAAPPS